jgi:hypothetical protein
MNTGSAPAPVTPVIQPLIVERDDGQFQIGFHDDAPGPFESREFAQAVAGQGEGRHASAT